jgi:hypothetical protein
VEIVRNSVVLSSSQDTTWAKMVDWKSWPTWDGGMESVNFEGPIHIGSSGKLKLKDGPVVTLMITDFKLHESYTSEFVLFGTRLIFGHILTPLDGGLTKMTVTAEAEGPTAFLIGNFVNSKIAKGVPQWMRNFQTALNENASTTS